MKGYTRKAELVVCDVTDRLMHIVTDTNKHKVFVFFQMAFTARICCDFWSTADAWHGHICRINLSVFCKTEDIFLLLRA